MKLLTKIAFVNQNYISKLILQNFNDSKHSYLLSQRKKGGKLKINQ